MRTWTLKKKEKEKNPDMNVRRGYLLSNRLSRHQLRFNSDEEPYERPALRALPLVINTGAAVLPAVPQQHGWRVHFERTVNLPGKARNVDHLGKCLSAQTTQRSLYL